MNLHAQKQHANLDHLTFVRGATPKTTIEVTGYAPTDGLPLGFKVIDNATGNVVCEVKIQDGPRNDENGVNGLVAEEIGAILVALLEPATAAFGGSANLLGLAGAYQALGASVQRTEARIAKGIEGTRKQ
ncbi:MAG: hypothetical protein KDD70_03950 [Bdellovibrionales bacterium]|nr:hypothetical protein [Bdellovibrionales bacterium]